MIAIGTPCPDFTLKDQSQKEVSLKSLKGKKVLLSFHPLAFTPVCEEQMKVLEAHYTLLENLKTVPLGISIDSVFVKAVWAKQMEVERLRLLADFWPHGKLAQDLGIFREKDGFSERANLILDEEGKVVFVKTYPMSQIPDFKEILDFLKK